MTGKKRTPLAYLLLAVLTVVAASLAAAASGQQSDSEMTSSVRASQDRRSGFGRPESITGTVTLVNPEEGLLVVAEHAPGRTTTIEVTGASAVTPNPDGTASATDTVTSAAQVPAPTDYRFRVTGSTLITLNGQRATLNDLSGVQGKQVTVHFIPQRNGNFAKGIEVSE